MKRLFCLLFMFTLAISMLFILCSCKTSSNLDDADDSIDDLHLHDFKIQSTESKYLNSSADCMHAAKYFYSCECGEIGTNTFNYGEVGNHIYDNKICMVCGLVLYSEGLEYTLSEDGSYYVVTGIGKCMDSVIAIPPIHESIPVKGIGQEAFCYRYEITKVILPDSITFIGEAGFDSCIGMTEITLSNELTEIGDFAFLACVRLTSIVIPDNVTTIGEYAFGCSGLTSVTIGSGLVNVADDAFSDCYKIVEVINHSNQYLGVGSADFGGLSQYAKEVHSGESKIINIDDYLFYTFGGVNYMVGYVGSDVDITLPINYRGQPYELYPYSFAYYIEGLLTSVILPKGITVIPEGAFNECCDLKEITIPDTVTRIDKEAFYNCDKLTIVELPDSITEIGRYAFGSCERLTSITLGTDLVSISQDAFYGSKLIEIVNNSNLDIIVGSELYGAIAESVLEVHNGKSKIVNIDGYLFYTLNNVNYLVAYSGKDTKLILPETFNGESYEIITYAFRDYKEITDIQISNGVTGIGEFAFIACSGLRSIVIPDNVTYIARYAFKECNNLTSVVIGNGITKIEECTFSACNNLVSITIGSSVTSIDPTAFSFNTGKIVEVINHSSLKIEPGTTDFGKVALSALEVHSGESRIVNLNGYLFYTYGGKNYLIGYVGEDTELVLPESYYGENYEIYKRAFYDCDIKTIIVPDIVTSIGELAFFGCTEMKTIVIGSGTKEIGNAVFYSCYGLKDVYYNGTEDEWKNIIIGNNNDHLFESTIHYYV